MCVCMCVCVCVCVWVWVLPPPSHPLSVHCTALHCNAGSLRQGVAGGVWGRSVGGALVAGTGAASLSTEASAPRRHGGLRDEDRIFTNLYGEHDVGIQGAEARVSGTHPLSLTHQSTPKHRNTHTHTYLPVCLGLGNVVVAGSTCPHLHAWVAVSTQCACPVGRGALVLVFFCVCVAPPSLHRGSKFIYIYLCVCVLNCLDPCASGDG